LVRFDPILSRKRYEAKAGLTDARLPTHDSNPLPIDNDRVRRVTNALNIPAQIDLPSARGRYTILIYIEKCDVMLPQSIR
jgi:hypothetical protein